MHFKISKKIFFNLFLICGCFSFLLTVFNCFELQKSLYCFRPISESKHIIQLSDNADDDNSAKSYYTNVSDLIRLKNFCHALENNTAWIYHEIIFQDTLVKNYKGTPIFYSHYTSNETEYDSIQINNQSYNSVKAVLLNDEAFYNSCFSLFAGKAFTPNDFIMSESKLPILLGYNYKDIYKPGDIIEGRHIDHPLQYKVIGILEKNSTIVHKDNIYYLDNYIIMPAPQINITPNNKSDILFQGATYLQKANGELLFNTEKDYEFYYDEFNELRKQYEIFDYDFINVTYSDALKQKKQLEKGLLLLIIASLLELLILVIGLFSKAQHSQRKLQNKARIKKAEKAKGHFS